MQKEELILLWSKITNSNSAEFEYQLISKDSIPILNIGYNRKGNRCLILEIPPNNTETFSEFIRENLSLKYFQKEKCICIILNDTYFQDLFDDFIISTYNKISKIVAPTEYLTEFVQHFYKWTALFEKKANEDLTKEQIKGLFGELLFLKNSLKASANANETLLSWRGPYDTGHDFVSDFINHEIKTLDKEKNEINISSEHQLECELGKKLTLVVFKVVFDLRQGNSIGELINEIKKLIINKIADNTILLKALMQKGLESSNIMKYDVYKWLPINETHFQINDNFPKIVKSQLPEEIIEVKYKLKMNLLDSFIETDIKY